jgi:hypothetical protein
MTKLTSYQAYRAMYNFMGELYDTMDNDTLGAVLESLRIKRETGLPVNKNLKNDWEKLAARSGLAVFDSGEAWKLMEEFLRGIGQALDSLQMDKVISYIALNENNRAVRATWEEMVEIAAGEEEEWDEL